MLCSDAVTLCIFTFLTYFYLIQDNTDDEEEESEKSKSNVNDDDEEETGEVMFIGFDSLYLSTIHNLPFIACMVVFVLSAVRFGSVSCIQPLVGRVDIKFIVKVLSAQASLIW